MKLPIELVIADKNPWVLRGLEQMFAADRRFHVVAVVSDGEAFMDVVRTQAVDVAVVGWVLPKLSGRGVLTAVRELERPPQIVVYTGYLDPDTPRQVMALGGAAFCSKRAEPERLLETVTAVAHGNMVFPRMEVGRLYDDPLDHLTQRELQLLAELAQGATNAAIGRQMGISPNTVKFHLKNLYEKLEVRNRAQAIALYVGSRGREE